MAKEKTFSTLKEIGLCEVAPKLGYTIQLIQDDSTKERFLKVWKQYRKEGSTEWSFGNSGLFNKADNLDVLKQLTKLMEVGIDVLSKLPKVEEKKETTTKPVDTIKVGDKEIQLTPELLKLFASFTSSLQDTTTTKKGAKKSK
jgi:hypothetical protein